MPKSAHPLKEIRTDNRPQLTTMEQELSHHKIKQNKHKQVEFCKNVLLGGKKAQKLSQFLAYTSSYQ